MKFIRILFIFIISGFSIECECQSISPSVFNSIGTTFQSISASMDINIGEPITGLITDGQYQITQGLLQPNLNTVNLKVYLQGFYTGQGLMDNSGAGGCLYVTGNSPNPSDADTIRLTLINPVSHAEVETANAILQTDGSASFDFHRAMEGYYYLKVNHRNTLETWSANPVSVLSRSEYDFTSSVSQAYGNNMTETFDSNGWAFYSGDISDTTFGSGHQDDVIESQDYLDMENAVSIILFGYVSADITGDGVVESTDYILMENNVNPVLYSQHP